MNTLPYNGEMQPPIAGMELYHFMLIAEVIEEETELKTAFIEMDEEAAVELAMQKCCAAEYGYFKNARIDPVEASQLVGRVRAFADEHGLEAALSSSFQFVMRGLMWAEPCDDIENDMRIQPIDLRFINSEESMKAIFPDEET